MTPRRPRDAGVAGVWLVTATAVVLSAAMAASALGAVLVARQRAQNAADLAALAAAGAMVRGGDPCASGAEVARAGGARLVACTPDTAAQAVAVGVAVEVPGGWSTVLDVPPARASARAGVPP